MYNASATTRQGVFCRRPPTRLIAILSFHLGGGICSLSQQAARELDRPAHPELEAMVGFDHAKAKAGAERLQLSA
jgi:hypothetical protein